MNNLLPESEKYVQLKINNIDRIDAFRRTLVKTLVEYISRSIRNDKVAKLLFVSTQNSIRSQLSQVWARVAAFYFDVPHVEVYSGGVEVSAVHRNCVEALRQAGMGIKVTSGNNPGYEILFSEIAPAIKIYSKYADAYENPKEKFVAIINSSQADEGCPVISGANYRFMMIYKDLKKIDNTIHEISKFAELNEKIAIELLYIFYLCRIELSKSIQSKKAVMLSE